LFVFLKSIGIVISQAKFFIIQNIEHKKTPTIHVGVFLSFYKFFA